MNEVSPQGAHNRSGSATLFSRFSRYRKLLRRRWWVLFLTTSIGICVAAWMLYNRPPSFESNSRMMVSGQIRLQEGSTYSEEVMNFYGTQVELMQSGQVRQRAIARVQALKPDRSPAPVILQVIQPARTSIFILRATGSDAGWTPVPPFLNLDRCRNRFSAHSFAFTNGALPRVPGVGPALLRAVGGTQGRQGRCRKESPAERLRGSPSGN